MESPSLPQKEPQEEPGPEEGAVQPPPDTGADEVEPSEATETDDS